MNELTKFLVNSILNEDEDAIGTVALFGGGFKPPTKGHLEVVLQGLREYPEVKQIYILVGSGVRNNISQEEAVKIWKMYQQFIPVASEIVSVSSPFTWIKEYLTDHKDEKVYIFIGARPGDVEDEKDVIQRSKFAKKYSDKVLPVQIKTTGGVSGTKARAAAKISKEEFFKFIPSKLSNSEKDQIFDYIQSVVTEKVEEDGETITCDSCGWSWEYGEGGDNLNICHKCGHDNSPGSYVNLTENASYSKDIDYKGKILDLTKHMLNKGMNIKPLPKVIFKNGDSENARDFYGKTAYYNPNNQTIVLYTEGRHPKDIVRSFSHEMIHHIQNLEGRLGNITTTNTQEDDNLNDIEAEANLKGTMTFRNWTDSLQEGKGGADTSWTGADNETITLQDILELTKNIKIVNLPTEKLAPIVLNWDDNPEEIERISQVKISTQYPILVMVDEQNKIQWILDGNHRAQKALRAKSKTIPAKLIKPSNLNSKARKILLGIIDEGKNKDPFGLNAYARELALGLEEAILSEGAYDALTTKLTKATITKWVEDFKKKPKLKKSFVDIDIDEEDGKGRPIEFNYVGMVEFTNKVDGYEVDGTSNSGEEEDKIPFIATLFKINPEVLPQAWSKISADVSDVIRHEIEHLTQSGENVRPGKYKDDDIRIRDMINKLKILPQKNYYLLDKEVDAMLQGLYLKAKKTRKPFADVINNYLDVAPGIETKEDKEMILNLWRGRRKALSLPLFEQEDMGKEYKIYLDMDGVIVDFDKRFKDLAGMGPREYEDSFGKEKFWDFIDSKEKGGGVGFWVGMPWMSGGEALYNRVAQHDHALLSSPSRSESSKIGKRLWRKKFTPSTKLILAQSYNKKNYADKDSILIDDRESNIQQWREAGGIGILYKSAAQVNKELDKLGL